MKSQKVYLQHILECIARVEEYTSIGRDEFLMSRIAQDATLRQLQVVAESDPSTGSKRKRLAEELSRQAWAAWRPWEMSREA